MSVFLRRTVPFLLLLFSPMISLCQAQDGGQGTQDQAKQDTDQPKPVPVISGALAFEALNTAGNPALVPFIEPVALVPIGDQFLVEARAELLGIYTRKNGNSGPYGGPFLKDLGYLQADYIANPHVTVVAGKFLIPFGIYTERQDVVWIKTFLDDPLTLPIGSPTGAGDGGMLRGVVTSSNSAVWNYAVYYTAASRVNQFQSPGTAGFRTGVFFPQERFEAGVSYQRVLQNLNGLKNSNPFGFYASWQPNGTSADIKWEYAHSPTGAGYWLQAATRLGMFHVWQNALKRFELAGRVQQTFSVNRINSLTGADTNQGDVGLNFYILENTRVVSSYGRAFSSAGNYNLWTVGFTHRFTLPMWPGGKQ